LSNSKKISELKISKLKKRPASSRSFLPGPFIFATAGTGPYQFNRLFEYLDEIVSKEPRYRVLAQIGSSTYTPKNYEYLKFVTKEKFEQLMKKAQIIVGTGSAGTTIECVIHRKPYIILPRRVRFGEGVNDSSVSIAKMFEKRGLAIAAHDRKSLEDAIKKAENLKIKYNKDIKLAKKIDEYLKNI